MLALATAFYPHSSCSLSFEPLASTLSHNALSVVYVALLSPSSVKLLEFGVVMEALVQVVVSLWSTHRHPYVEV